jgi:hypothetical protein
MFFLRGLRWEKKIIKKNKKKTKNYARKSENIMTFPDKKLIMTI